MAKARSTKSKLARQAARVGVAAKQGRCRAALFHYTVLVSNASRTGNMQWAMLPKVRKRLHKHCMR